MTLGEWAAWVAAARRDWNHQPVSGTTAGGLVLDDRRERSDGGPVPVVATVAVDWVAPDADPGGGADVTDVVSD